MARDSRGEVPIIFADIGDTAPPGVANFDEGYELSYEQTGGKKIERTGLNKMMQQLYAMGMDISQYGGSLPYSATIDFLPDGVVTEAGVLYICLLANGPASAVKVPGVAGSETFWTASGASAGALKSVQVFTASGTWNKPAGINSVRVAVVAGGGGGGFDNAGGAGAGGVADEFIDVSATASETVTVGLGGAGDTTSGGAGVTGGTSSFGAFCSATGGLGGNSLGGSPVRAPGVGGVGVGGDVNITGGGGTGGDQASNLGGTGGSNAYGGGGIGGAASGVGADGGDFGGGGGGGSNAGAAGGTGADGVVIVWEYS